MDIVECYLAYVAAIKSELKAGAPSRGWYPVIAARDEASTRLPGQVIEVTDAITGIVASANELELAVASGVLNYREVVIPGMGIGGNVDLRAAVPRVQADPAAEPGAVPAPLASQVIGCRHFWRSGY
jgi:hypothetical protein